MQDIDRVASRDVFAVVVSYCGHDKIAKTIEALVPQVGLVYVVDNGSDALTLHVLREMQARRLISLNELGSNRGLGHALNIGARKANELRFSWLLTMDQDSVPAPDMVAAMLALASRSAARCISPNLIVHGERSGRLRGGTVGYAITSGNLVHLDVWRRAGPYNEDFFIDCIDFDFSLRARRCGFPIHKEPAAILHHELGQRTEIPAFVRRHYTQHSPMRRYYMFRNFLYLAQLHVLREPRFIGKLFLSHILLFVLLLAYEPQLKKNLTYISRGLLDFFRGKRGAYVGDGVR